MDDYWGSREYLSNLFKNLVDTKDETGMNLETPGGGKEDKVECSEASKEPSEVILVTPLPNTHDVAPTPSTPKHLELRQIYSLFDKILQIEKDNPSDSHLEEFLSQNEIHIQALFKDGSAFMEKFVRDQLNEQQSPTKDLSKEESLECSTSDAKRVQNPSKDFPDDITTSQESTSGCLQNRKETAEIGVQFPEESLQKNSAIGEITQVTKAPALPPPPPPPLPPPPPTFTSPPPTNNRKKNILTPHEENQDSPKTFTPDADQLQQMRDKLKKVQPNKKSTTSPLLANNFDSTPKGHKSLTVIPRKTNLNRRNSLPPHHLSPENKENEFQYKFQRILKRKSICDDQNSLSGIFLDNTNFSEEDHRNSLEPVSQKSSPAKYFEMSTTITEEIVTSNNLPDLKNIVPASDPELDKPMKNQMPRPSHIIPEKPNDTYFTVTAYRIQNLDWDQKSNGQFNSFAQLLIEVRQFDMSSLRKVETYS